MAGGVCGGLADYSGVDAVLWRVGFVALTLLGGGGVLLYLLLWVLLPPPATGDHEPLSPLERLARRLHTAVNGSRVTPPQHR
jgi:phage shock protein PspC (stress-responsive transcriptional regulator)